jgi:hypothetical protein
MNTSTAATTATLVYAPELSPVPAQRKRGTRVRSLLSKLSLAGGIFLGAVALVAGFIVREVNDIAFGSIVAGAVLTVTSLALYMGSHEREQRAAFISRGGDVPGSDLVTKGLAAFIYLWSAAVIVMGATVLLSVLLTIAFL